MKRFLWKTLWKDFSWQHLFIILLKGAAVATIAILFAQLALETNEPTFVFQTVTILFGIACVLFLIIPKKMPTVLQIIVFALLPTVCFYLLERCTHSPMQTMQLDAIILNLIFYYLVAFFIVLVTGKPKIASYVLILIGFITGLANYFVILFRSIPILPWDFYSLKTAASVADNYEYTVTFPVLYIVYGFLLLFLLTGHLTFTVPWKQNTWSSKKVKNRIWGRIAVLFLCVIGFGSYIHVLWQPNVHKIFTGLNNTLFTPGHMFRTNGFAVAFIMDLRYMGIDVPEGYSAEAIETFLAELEESAETSNNPNATELPNIIVIMNETFSDPAVLGEFTTNEDYMPFVHSLMNGADNTISGYMYASILGGNTANSEFEFLTGNTMAFLPIGSVPYQQYIRSEVEGVTSHLKDLGYSTTAMHPYNSTGWNRTKVYDLMKFDSKYFISSFSGGERVRNYISDACLYDKILSKYTLAKNAPFFAFAVTMQNHSGYGDGFNYDNFSVDIEMQEANSKYLNTYLSLMKVSDTAFEEFVSYFEEQDEKTIVLMFGDHQPNDYVINSIYNINGLNFDEMSLAEQQNRYKVPFVLWANYDIEEETDITISANYISSLLMDVAGLPKTAYQTFLGNLREEIPVITANMYIDKNGGFHTLDEENEYSELIHTYEKLQYYNLFE